jgi:hypothetical protein
MRKSPLNLKTLRLFSKTRKDPISGKHRMASSSDGIIDVAAAVHIGLIPNDGLPSLLYQRHRTRVARLLKSNFVGSVSPKLNTTNGIHASALTRYELAQALKKVIGPLYSQHIANRIKSIADINRAFALKSVLAWLIPEIEDPASNLNSLLAKHGYTNLVELKRARRWWYDHLKR